MHVASAEDQVIHAPIVQEYRTAMQPWIGVEAATEWPPTIAALTAQGFGVAWPNSMLAQYVMPTIRTMESRVQTVLE